MEQLSNGYTLSFSPDAFPLGTDSMVLSGFVRLGRNAQVLDLGSGCGTLGVLLCARDPGCRVTGIEVDPEAHAMALRNAADNGLQLRLDSICGDIREIPKLIPPGSFSVCVSNPPYFSGGPASISTPNARRDDLCSLEQLFHSAAWAVKYGGDFYLVHRAERLAEICACAARNQMEVKRLCLVRHKPESPVSVALFQCRKGAKPGVQLEELTLHESDGSHSQAYRQLYHL